MKKHTYVTRRTSSGLRLVPCAIMALTAHLSAAELLNEDFSANDGGFVQEATGNTPIDATYNNGTGTWSIEGDDAGPATNTLTSPEITVDSTAGIRVTLEHRYSIEVDWDGVGLQVSIDDGPFENVPKEAFTQNGYDNTAPLIGNHVLGGLDGFNGDSAGYADGDFITSIADVGGVGAGSKIRVRIVGAFDEGARGAGIPNWEINSILVDTLDDTDGDGIPDTYEDANGLDKSVNDAGDDDDSDDSDNISEYLNKTDPQDEDSDDDTLKDGIETNTGVFVDATDTGTNPLSDDSDGDGLKDAVENGSGVFVDADNPGTNPVKSDTDEDGFDDGSEIKSSSDPLDPASVPAGWTVRNATSTVALNSIADTRALFENAADIINETTTSETTINFRDNANGPFPDPRKFPVLDDQDVAVDDYGLLATGSIFIEEPGIYTFGFNSDDGGGLFIDGEPAVVDDRNRGSTTSLDTIKLSYGNHVMDFVYWERGGGAQVQVFVAKEMGDQTGVPFDVANYELLETSFTETVDSEGDGLDDNYELKFFGDLSQGADGDFDDDGLSNIDEFNLALDPTEEDTDDDGYKDGVETGTGTFVDATNTGSDPCNPDSDGDGLKDGVETGTGTFVDATNTGSDPNKDDTDDDGVKDGAEVADGFDPNDPENKPAIPVVTIIDGLIGGDLTDPEDDGVEGETAFGPPQTAGENWNWVSIAASQEEYFGDFGGSEGAFDLFDNNVGAGQAKWCCGGAPVDLTVQFEEPVSLTHFTLTSGNDVAARDPLDFEIQGSNDGTTFETIYSRQSDEPIWTPEERNTTARIDLPSPSNAYEYLRYSVTRTGNANHQLNEIEYFGEVGGGGGLVITDIDFNPENDLVTLTWNSKKNRTYSVFSSTDLLTFEEEIDDSVESDGEVTQFSFTNFPAGAPKTFFIVIENE